MNIIEPSSLRDVSKLPEKLVNHQFSVIRITGQGETTLAMQEPTFVSVLMVSGKDLEVKLVADFKKLETPDVTIKRLYQKGTNTLIVKYDTSVPLEAYLLLELQSAVLVAAQNTNMPGMLTRAKNFGKAVHEHLKNNLEHADEQTLLNRINTCHACEYRDEKYCKKCGCYLPTKQKWQSSKCPDRRW
jgi:hypothetical protein